MKSTLFAALVLVALPTLAAENTSCSSTSFSEVHSLSGLPNEVVNLFSGIGSNRVADSNEKFNATDAISAGYENAPFRRFNFAAVSQDRILVAVEHGGRGYSVELWSFERGKDGWRPEKRGFMNAVPRTLLELIEHVCN